MTNNRTFTMLKPDSVEKGNIGAILEKITASGFKVVAMKLTQLTVPDAEKFYDIHSDKPFFFRFSWIHDSWANCSCCFGKRKCS